MKEINIHDDYVLWLIYHQLTSQLGVICSYMQETTPYGDEYEKAFAKIKELREVHLPELEGLLQACVEASKKGPVSRE